MGFGSHLKKLREDCKMSAQVLADRLLVKVERLRKWEQFDKEPQVDDAILIEAAFGMPIQDIMKLKKMPDSIKIPNENGILIDNAQGNIISYLIRIESKINILFSNEAEKIANETGSKATDVLREMNAAALIEAENLQKALKSSRG